MSLKKEFDNLKFDIRMQDINLGSKLITEDEIKANLANAVDCSANATQVNIDEPEEEVQEEVAAEAPEAQDAMMGSFNPNSNPFGSDSN